MSAVPSNGDGQTPSIGAAPPHSLQAEQSVLGAILLWDGALYGLVIEEGLRAEDFYKDRHRLIYESMLALYQESQPVDPLTVTEHLRSRGELENAGGQAEVDALTGAVPAVGNAMRYGRIVREHALLRRLLAKTYEIQTAVLNRTEQPNVLVELAERGILEVAHDDRTKDFRQVGEVLEHEIDKWQKLSREGISLTGTPSGFGDLDEITGGFQPGNLIILAARPSMGKCLGKGTIVPDPDRGIPRRIEDVVELVRSGEEVFVTALGSDLKLHRRRVVAGVESGRQPVFRLRTRLGRQVDATANHPFLTIEGWRRLDELAPGSRLAAPRALPEPPLASPIPDHELVLLGALIADGNLTQRTPRFCFGRESAILDEVIDAADAMGLRLSDEQGPATACISAGRGAGPNPLTELLRMHGLWGKGSADKFVPEAIFQGTNQAIARFLGVMYACDGHIYTSGNLSQIGYTTISEQLAYDVQHLLLRLGINARIRKLKRDVYEGTEVTAREVLITGQDGLLSFCRQVRVYGKTAKLAEVVDRLFTVRAKTNVDTLPPEAWNLVAGAKGEMSWRQLGVRAGYPGTHNWHVGTRGLSRPRMAQLAEVLDNSTLQHLAESDIWWDEVESIEPLGEMETYDLQVEGDANFVAGNLISHNSALVTNIAENVALHPERPQPVALFSLEMSEAELAQRFIASQATIKGDDLRKGRLKDERKWKRVLDTATRYDKAPLFVDDSSDIGILEIRAKARRLHQQTEGGLGLIIVDYLQLMRPDPTIDSRVQQVGEMSRGLKILARELGVPVIALSQLSRAVESRSATDKRPMLSDLRECVTGDTLVCLADGRRVPIADLVGTQPEVWALDDRDRVIRAGSDLVWPVGRREVYEVRLASGRRVRATADHRIRTGGGWSTIGALAVNDRVALASRIPEPVEPVHWPDEHVILLGQLIGDGSYLSGQPMRYTTASEENSEAVRVAAESFGATVKRYRGRGSWHQLLISGNGNRWAPKGVNAWLRQLGVFGQRSHEKRVPAEAFRLGDRQVGMLLSHLWATDGCLWVGARPDGRPLSRVAYGTSSRGLADDVAALLLRLGIIARIVETPGPERPMYQVTVTGAVQQRRFLDRVGSFGPRREHEGALRTLLRTSEGSTNVDTLPLQTWQLVRGAMQRKGISQRAMAAMRGTSYGGNAHFAFAPSRTVVQDYAALLEDTDLAALLDAELFWDRVVAIEPAGEEEVFDLTVPGPSCWLADGIVSHNSGQIEQDADLVMFIYRDEYYFPETTEHPGEAELIIAKHRNGGLGTVNVSFQGEFPRFLGLSRQEV
jgi:replicative DNA helicase